MLWRLLCWLVQGEEIGSVSVGACVRALSAGPDGRIACGTGKAQVIDITLADASAPSEDGATLNILTKCVYPPLPAPPSVCGCVLPASCFITAAVM